MSQTQRLLHPIADIAIENLWWGSSELKSTLHWWHFLMQPRRKYQTTLLGLISSRPASAVRYPRLRSQLNCKAHLWTGCSCIIKAVPSGKVAVYYSNLKNLWLEPECSALTVVFAERKVLLGGWGERMYWFVGGNTLDEGVLIFFKCLGLSDWVT